MSRYGAWWLLAAMGPQVPLVYCLLFAWGLYYMYVYWGGLGPGRLF